MAGKSGTNSLTGGSVTIDAGASQNATTGVAGLVHVGTTTASAVHIGHAGTNTYIDHDLYVDEVITAAGDISIDAEASSAIHIGAASGTVNLSVASSSTTVLGTLTSLRS
ncbi:hypothetical protein KIPB_016836 [Kipferlia bialata]|uniref:Uncharacterized protein n=1 Tax=Kipferlia bialata TaxID=797122 RepID=A0A391NW00_9EUKA|nr:hypothetical protein KIPB_016836 [Kipferlia bialata]|eukprot:g16836.t1